MANAEKRDTDGLEEIRERVRFIGKDMDGHLTVEKALLNIKGISFSTVRPIAMLIERELNIDRKRKIGSLTYEELESIEKLVLNDLTEDKLPAYLLNRRRDYYTGKSVHVVGNDLIFLQRQDIQRKVRNKTWQGYRHITNQPVRGQRTANTHREGRTVGVSKKKK